MDKVDAETVAKITYGNAMRHFQFDPFASRSRESATAGSLRAEAADVDTVTRVGRQPDASDIEAFQAFAGGAAAVGARSRP
jgi:hypothetical protein